MQVLHPAGRSRAIGYANGIDPGAGAIRRALGGAHDPATNMILVADLLEHLELIEHEATAALPARRASGRRNRQ